MSQPREGVERTLGWKSRLILKGPQGPLSDCRTLSSQPDPGRPFSLVSSCHPSILLSLALPLTCPHMHLHSHYMSNTLSLDHISLPCVPSSSSLSNARQTPTHLPSPSSYLLFQEACSDSLGHILLQHSVHTALRILMIIMAKHY